MSTVEVKGKDPRGHMDVGPVKPWLPSAQKKLEESRKGKVEETKTEETPAKVDDLYKKAQEEQEGKGHDYDSGEEGIHHAGLGLSLPRTELRNDFDHYLKAITGKYSMFQEGNPNARAYKEEED